MVQLAAVLLALLIGAIMLLVSGANPIEAYGALLRGSFGSMTAFGRTLEKATPMIFSRTGSGFRLQSRDVQHWRPGAAAVWCYYGRLSGFCHPRLTSFHSHASGADRRCAGGRAYAIIPGALKAYRGAHEVITTIMLNYIAINITDLLADGPWKDTSPGNVVARTPLIDDAAVIG